VQRNASIVAGSLQKALQRKPLLHKAFRAILCRALQKLRSVGSDCNVAVSLQTFSGANRCRIVAKSVAAETVAA
jgi:hypothetical protein